jgi:signal transduction histidine kinase
LALVLGLPLAGLLALRAMQGALGFRISALIVAGAVAVITLVLAWLLWRLILRPVTALTSGARAVEAGAAAGRMALGAYGTAELSDLGRVVLGMAETLQRREAAIRSFADHAVHELKTPLTAIKGAAEMLADGPLGASDARLVANIRTSVARMEAELAALRAMAAAREPRHHGNADLGLVVADLRGQYPGLEMLAPTARLPLSGEGLSMVLGQLAQNAAHAGATRLDFRVEHVPDGPLLTVADNGPGISPGNRARVFEPFFTTGRATGGTGMGLAIARAVMEAHGHEIALLPEGPGARFRLIFAG